MFMPCQISWGRSAMLGLMGTACMQCATHLAGGVPSLASTCSKAQSRFSQEVCIWATTMLSA